VSPQLNAEAEQAALITSVSTYKNKYGRYPQGSNQDILAELQGKRSRSLIFIELPSRAIDASGNFLDPWGNAYLFEFPNKDTAVVRSSGRDRKYFTSDDITRGDK
jgi:hypothetical protein